MGASATKSKPVCKPLPVEPAWFGKSWGCEGGDNGNFSSPTDVAVGMDGVVYVVDGGNRRVQCFNPNGSFISKWGKYGKEDGDFDYPFGIAIDVQEGIHECVLSALSALPEFSAYPPGIVPIFASYVGDERIYITDVYNHTVQAFSRHGRFILKWGQSGTDNGKLCGPMGCSVGKDGSVYVVDYGNRRVQVFDSRGTFIRTLRETGLDGKHICPRRVSVSQTGRIYVSDFENNRLLCYRDDNPDDLYEPLAAGNVSPDGLCTSDDDTGDEGRVYFTDPKRSCIWQMTMHGTLIRKWGSRGNQKGQFCAVAQGNGQLYVVDCSNNRIVVIRLGKPFP